MALEGGSIQDAADNAADLTLPPTGSDGLAAQNLVIETATPTVAMPASAAPNPAITGTSTALTVLGADADVAEGSLIYTWTVLAIPSGAATPTFSVNGTNAAKNSVATLSAPGSYTFQVTISNPIGLSVTSSVVVAVHDAPPAVAAVTPTGLQTGNVTITYTLAEAQSDPCSIQAQYSVNGGATWLAAQAAGGDGASNLASTPGGTTHTYVWNSLADLGGVNNSNVTFRITPADAGLAGTAGATGTFTVNNLLDPLLSVSSITTPSGTQSGNVTISYTLKDVASIPCSIQVQFSKDGGATWSAAQAAGGDGTSHLALEPRHDEDCQRPTEPHHVAGQVVRLRHDGFRSTDPRRQQWNNAYVCLELAGRSGRREQLQREASHYAD